MKKILMAIIIVSISVTTAYSQVDVTLTDLEAQFEDMGKAIGGAVASTSTAGLLWSDAYIGNFPHFGVGAFVGATVMPSKGFVDVLKVVDPAAALPSQIVDMGVPIPAVGFEGRLGGFVLPFDIGLKYAAINYTLDTVNLKYNLIGFDVRYAIIKDGPLPKVSAGIGFSRLTTDITVSGILDGDYDILKNPLDSTRLLYLTNPDLEYGWETNVIEFKAQVSKSLLLITPYLGFDAAYSMTKVGGGIKTSVKNAAGDTLTQSEVDTIVQTARDNGATVPDIDADGFSTIADVNAWGFKIYGGTSINIFILKLDLSVNYDLIGKTYGGQLGFRVQF